MLTRILIVFLSLIIYHLSFITPVYAVCDATDPVEKRDADCAAGLDQFEAMVGQLISVIVGLAFVATLVMLIMAGFKYLTSGGEPKAIQVAHQTFTWALLGILFMAVAWVILQLIQAFTGISVTTFDIKVLCGDSRLLFCQP